MFPFQPGDDHTAACESCEKEFPSVPALKNHLVSSCPEKLVPCRQADNGCVWRGRRVSLETHIGQCPYESIKGFFAIHNTQMAQLSEDNGRLRRRADELEGTVRVLRQELEWVKVALGPWCRPVYPERPSMSVNYAQYPNDEGASTGSAPSRVGPIFLRGVDPTGGTSLPEPRVESGVTETFGFVDPFSFVGQRGNQVLNIYAANSASTTTSGVGTDPNARPQTEVVESHDHHDLNIDASYEPGYSNGSGSIYNTPGTALSPGAGNLQSTSTAPPLVLLSDYFPSEDQGVFEGGSSYQPRNWQHGSSPADSVPPNPSPSIQSSVSNSTFVTQTGRGDCDSLITHSEIGVVDKQNQPLAPGQPHSHLASSCPAPCNQPQFMPSINKHAIAPLNLSTTVEGSLVGLRESLVTLSAALESQGRRLELALTAEGLRVSEEVGSLKAIVQGLRMQVSSHNAFVYLRPSVDRDLLFGQGFLRLS